MAKMSKQTTSVSAFFIKLRMWIQIGCLLLLNSDFAAFFRGVMKRKASISKASTKQFCVPGLNCYSCPSAVGACPIGALQFWLNDTANKIKMGQEVNLSGLYILGMMETVGALVGRLPCGWICPFGLVQDWLGHITKSNRKIAGVFKYLKYVVLIVCVIILPSLAIDGMILSPWFCKLICPSGTLFAGLPLLAMDADLRSMVGVFTIIKVTFLVFVIVMSMFYKRFFCKVFCPLGAFWGMFNRVSVVRLRYNHQQCVQCKRCEDICPMNIKVTQEPNTAECIRCMRCVAVCPSKAIDMNSSIVLNGWIERYKTFRKAKQKEMMQKMHEKMLQKNEPKHNTMEETPPEMTIVQPEVAALPESQTVLCLEDHSEVNPTENEIIIIEDYGADNGDNQPFNPEECQLSEQVRLDAALSDTEVGKPSEDRD